MKKTFSLYIVIAMSMNAYAQENFDLEKVLVKEVSVNSSKQEVWRAFTIEEEVNTFFAPDSRIDLWPGGRYEIYFDLSKKPGLRGTEGCKVLSLLPGEMLSVSWNAPPHFPEERTGSDTWVVFQFEEITPDQTRVRLSHAGWKNEGRWDDVYKFFDNAWDIVLSSLKKKFSDDTSTTEYGPEQKLFIYYVTLTDDYKDPARWTDETHKIIQDHAQFLRDLGDKGILIQAGRTLYPPGHDMLFGFALIKANSIEEAREIMKKDPSRLNNIQQATIHEFSLGIRYLHNAN